MTNQIEDKFNAVVFEAKIHQELADQVKGYSVVITADLERNLDKVTGLIRVGMSMIIMLP